MAASDVQFFVAIAPDRTAIGVFTMSMIGPDPMRSTLERACARLPGPRVSYADWGVLPEDAGDRTRLTYGTCGVVRYDGPQSAETLSNMQAAIIEELVAEGYTAMRAP